MSRVVFKIFAWNKPDLFFARVFCAVNGLYTLSNQTLSHQTIDCQRQKIYEVQKIILIRVQNVSFLTSGQKL